ncbi:GTP pyrophosphokinase, partial [Salmonella enterica]
KKYANPYHDITDKAGIRFVVLLTSDIKKIEEALISSPAWEYSKDRDYEEERLAKPLVFTYQSVHYVVRAIRDIEVDGVR